MTVAPPKRRKVLRSIVRNKMLLPTVAKDLFFANDSLAVFRSWVRDEIKLGYLTSYPTDYILKDNTKDPDPKTYLRLGKRGCKLLGVSHSFASELDGSKIIYPLSCLAVTSMQKPYRSLFTREQLVKRYPFVATPLGRCILVFY